MKKYKRLFLLLLTLSLTFILTGCNSKTYATVEEWYNDVGKNDRSLQQSLHTETKDGTMDFSIEGNKLVYRFKYKEQVFGTSDQADSTVKSILDKSLEKNRDSYIQLIDQFAGQSKVDATSISVVVEYYNPGSSTSSHTQTITK